MFIKVKLLEDKHSEDAKQAAVLASGEYNFQTMQLE